MSLRDKAFRLILTLDPGGLEREFNSRTVTQAVNPPFVIRLDGVGFGRALEGFKWPRDERVHKALLKAGRELMSKYPISFIHVVSDELNVYMLDHAPYGGREFKLVSIMAGITSSIVSLELNRPLYFDARVVLLRDKLCDVLRYFAFRLRVGFNNYHLEIAQRKGLIPLDKTPDIGEVLKRLEGPRLDWESLGTCLIRREFEFEGVDKLTGRPVRYRRRKVVEADPLEVLADLMGECGLNPPG